MRRRFPNPLTAAILIVAVVLLYLGVGSFEYLRFDDPDYTFACPFVKNGLTWSGVQTALTDLRHGAIWMPVTWLSYMADIAFLGSGAGVHHGVNVALHALNAVLLFFLCWHILGEKASLPVSLMVFLWALHPQRVEAVAWIASRKELLWTTFALVGLIAWLKQRRWVAYLFCALACLSKPTALVFPLLVGLLSFARSSSDSTDSRSFLSRLSPYLPLLVMAVFTGLIAMYSQTHPEGMAAKDLFYAPWYSRLLNACVAIGLGVAQAAVPVGLHLDYRAVAGFPQGGVLGLIVLTVTLVLCVWGYRRNPRLTLFAAGWYLVALLPTLGLFASFGEHARADRFLYVPAMALPLTIALLPRVANRIFISAAFVLALACIPLSRTLILSYRTDHTAFARTLACDPQHGRALSHVGEAECAAGQLDAGIAHLRESQALRPREATRGKLAYALMRRGRTADWSEIRTLCAPLAEHPEQDPKGQALEALGTAELVARHWHPAAAAFTASIRAPARFYSAEDARLKLAFALHNGGNTQAALQLFTALAASSRTDIASRATAALASLRNSPHALLFW